MAWLGTRLPGLSAWLIALGLLVSPFGMPRWVDAQSSELRMFTAASLTDAFQELGPIFESQNPGARAVFNFGPSSGLRPASPSGLPSLNLPPGIGCISIVASVPGIVNLYGTM